MSLLGLNAFVVMCCVLNKFIEKVRADIFSQDVNLLKHFIWF